MIGESMHGMANFIIKLFYVQDRSVVSLSGPGGLLRVVGAISFSHDLERILKSFFPYIWPVTLYRIISFFFLPYQMSVMNVREPVGAAVVFRITTEFKIFLLLAAQYNVYVNVA